MIGAVEGGRKTNALARAKQAIVIGAALLASIAALTFDWGERLARLLVQYEAIEADEYILVFLFLALGALGTALLRERRLRFELSAREEGQRAALVSARTDYLTGLPNRLALAECMKAAADDVHAPVSILLLDLDGFKEINDIFGHDAGDDVLKAIASRLQVVGQNVPGLTAFRLGGDEFALIFRGAVRGGEVERLATLILASVLEPIALNAQSVQVTGSIGVACSRPEPELLDELLRAADAAMFHAKRCGPGRFSLSADCPSVVRKDSCFFSTQAGVRQSASPVLHSEGTC